MTLTLAQTATAVGPRISTSFQGVGGAGSYVYAVAIGGAGGTINASTGVYHAPANASSDPRFMYDTIQVTDGAAATATATILVGSPLMLLCEILQKELGLSSDHIYLWDQKLTQPSDSGLYIAVSVPYAKPFGNVCSVNAVSGGMDADQFIAMQATIDIDIISRDATARDHKEDVLIALGGVYSAQQQDANSFSIGRLPPGGKFINLSLVDGAAIPYRYKISFNMQYAYRKSKAAPYFNNFDAVETVISD